MRKNPRANRQLSLQWRMAGVVMICWMIPFAFMIGILGVYLASNHSDMTAENFREQLEFNNKICVERLNGAVTASRQASYDGTLLATHVQYRLGQIDALRAGKQYKDYLTARYQKNDAISGALLWFDAKDEKSVYSVYNERANGSYQLIRDCQKNDLGQIVEYAQDLGTGIRFWRCGGNFYLIRNLVDSRFRSQGTLVLCLNKAYCFGSLLEYPLAEGAYIEVNGEPFDLLPSEQLERWESHNPAQERSSRYEWQRGRLFLSGDMSGNTYGIHTAMLLQKEVTQYPFYGYPYVLAVMLMSLIPMLLLMVYVFRRQVSDPVAVLSEGARHIEEGELGHQIGTEMESTEFTYLRDSFNHMSTHLKEQFDKIYREEIALREARIMALQSHINPHFMNNTLEIINWEARLGGNLKVSKMIEALSTMLDAAMDRRKRPQVRLVEEMAYVNSYLYITKERLGKRLEVEIDLPEELMDDYVPRLILQPVVENAIEHGIVPNGSGVVWIRGYEDGDFLYLETVNDGGLDDRDRERISRLLDPNYHTGMEPEGSLGIANVNQRLRILFGEPCGLMISENQEGKIVAKLTMPLQKWETKIDEMNKTEQ